MKAHQLSGTNLDKLVDFNLHFAVQREMHIKRDILVLNCQATYEIGVKGIVSTNSDLNLNVLIEP